MEMMLALRLFLGGGSPRRGDDRRRRFAVEKAQRTAKMDGEKRRLREELEAREEKAKRAKMGEPVRRHRRQESEVDFFARVFEKSSWVS